LFFFFQAEDGIRDRTVTGVQTCALPILLAAVEQSDLSDDLARTRRPDLHDAITGCVKQGRDVPIDDENELPRPVSLTPEDLALLRRAAAHQPRKLRKAGFVPAFEQRNGP